MSFSRNVSVLAASVAAAALLVAVPASAQTSMMTSNQAGPHSTMMAKTEPTPDTRPSTTAQASGGEKSTSLMAKAGNQLK
ncbi:MAG: hypothetical protein WA268_27120 [Xanthobacteraceae bacterium]|jgi:hypothetical protein